MTLRWSQNFDLKKLSEDALKRLHIGFDRAIQGEVREIVKRTQDGRDIFNRPFEPYSPEYFKFKTTRGRTGDVDLTFTGKMLGAMTSKVERVANKLVGVISFNNKIDGAKARGNMQRRKFFGFAEEQLQRLLEKLGDALNER